MRLAVVTADFSTGNGAAIKFAIIDCQSIDFGPVFADSADFLPFFSAEITTHSRLWPRAGMKASLVHRERMCLQKRHRVKRGGQTRVSPFVAVERKHTRPAGIEFSVVTAH